MELLIADVVILIALLLIGIPVPFAFAAATFFIVGIHGFDIWTLFPSAVDKTRSIAMFALPLFVMAGGLMETSGIASRLIDLANAIMGRIKGGLGTVTVVSCALFGAVSGSCLAALAAVGSIIIPRMKERGYPAGEPEALVSVSCVLALLIPPSMDMIIFGWMTSTSVPACFLATVGPGLLIMVLLSVANRFVIRKVATLEARVHIGFPAALKEIGIATQHALLTLGMPVIILGGIYGGVFTPTEAAAVAVFYALILGAIYRSFTPKSLGRTFITTATTSGVVMLMFFFVIALSYVYTLENVPKMIAASLLSISTNYYVILTMVMVLMIITGMLMSDTPGLMLLTPLLYPLMQQIGVHPLHFAALIGVGMGFGAATPPAAPALYLGARIGGITVDKIFKPAAIFLTFGFVPGLIATAFWPDLSLFLPRLLGFT